MPIQLILADDHLIVRQALKTLLEKEGFQVVGEASNGHEVLRMAQTLRHDMVVMDLSMPLLNGLDTIRELVQASKKARTILLTMHHEEHYILEAFRAGAKGYVLKNRAAGDLIEAIRAVARGEIFLSSGISQTLVSAYLSGKESPIDPLTSREHQVLQLVSEGKSTKEIASLLDISVKTAESHRTRLMRKLDIHETAGLVRYAIRRGMIQP